MRSANTGESPCSLDVGPGPRKSPTGGSRSRRRCSLTERPGSGWSFRPAPNGTSGPTRSSPGDHTMVKNLGTGDVRVRWRTGAEPVTAVPSVERPDHEPVRRRDALSLIDDALAQFVGRSLVA